MRNVVCQACKQITATVFCSYMEYYRRSFAPSRRFNCFRQVVAAAAFSQTHSVIGAALAFISVFIMQESNGENAYLTLGESCT